MIRLVAAAVYTFLICTMMLVTLAYVSTIVRASERQAVIQLEDAYINYRQFTDGGVSYLVTDNGLPDRALDKEISLHFNSSIFDNFYWNNNIHAATDKPSVVGGEHGQFRTIGWNFSLGVHLFQWLDFEYEHHSQHILDHAGPKHFPVEDSVGINLHLYRSSVSKEPIF